MKKTNLSMEMFASVNQFTGIDRQNLIVEGELDIYVPYVIKLLWFRSVHPKGAIKTRMSVSMDDIAKNRICVFVAEVFDGDGNLLATGHGSANADEDNFIEVAERRASGKALAAAGFTWHNGDFSNDTDVAKTQLSIYNKYIESGIFDIQDETVKMLYDDALVTILPEGYSSAGKPIAALDSLQLANIAKSYAVNNDGDPVINAKIKFVYQYQLLANESQKQPEPESVTTDQKDAGEKSEKQSRKKSGRKSKKAASEDNSETSNVTESENSQTEETVTDKPAETAEDEMSENQMKLADTPKTEPTVEVPMQEEMPEKVFSDEILAEDTEKTYDDNDGFYPIDEMDEDFDSPFEAIAEEFNDPFDERSYGEEIERELHKDEVLKKWGYANEQVLCADWKAHFMLVREKCAAVDWKDEQAAKTFVEEIPIYNNFIWLDKCEKDKVVLLGDFLNTHKDEVIEVINEGHFPLPALRHPVNWYITNVWGVF